MMFREAVYLPECLDEYLNISQVLNVKNPSIAVSSIRSRWTWDTTKPRLWCKFCSSAGVRICAIKFVYVQYGYILSTVCGPGSNPGGDEIFRPSRPALGPTASCTMGTGYFPRVKCGWGVLLTTYPLLVPRSWKSRAIPLPTLWATPGL